MQNYEELKQYGFRIRRLEWKTDSSYVIDYHIDVGTKRPGDTFFISNDKIRTILSRYSLEKDISLKGINFVIYPRIRKIEISYYPLSSADPSLKTETLLSGYGLASLLEKIVLKDLVQKGYGDYLLVHSGPSKSREKQLLERHGKKISKISVRKELEAIEKYEKEFLQRQVWGIGVLFTKVDVKEDKVFHYSTNLASREDYLAGKYDFFITNPQIREQLRKHNLFYTKELGGISVRIYDFDKTISLTYVPLGRDPDFLKKLQNLGIASIIEAVVLNDLMRKGYSDYSIVREILSIKRKRQLALRHKGKIPMRISVSQELKTLRNFIRRKYGSWLKIQQIKQKREKRMRSKTIPRKPFF